ncbi:NADH dehydrogenase (ubiquinone) complex I, assembly factor 6-like [Xenopus laevis]|uniref:NADH dehydrogenase (Ubiquinone) complex I, assembly factor 6-like n=1 Tax=Xenopus laevis TaxID=8355 RepID=A0A8J0VJ40_XENLA|nr:NADH dehydrogenase (ubiquinone) complex I, assembly factor 6-like [Xenopus laevis]
MKLVINVSPSQHGASQEDFIRGSLEKKAKEVIFDLASQAHVHLEHISISARSFKKRLQKSAFPAFNITVALDQHLKTLRKADFNKFHPSLQRRNSLLPLSLYARSWKQSY